jgi:hypothetical protein
MPPKSDGKTTVKRTIHVLTLTVPFGATFGTEQLEACLGALEEKLLAREAVLWTALPDSAVITLVSVGKDEAAEPTIAMKALRAMHDELAGSTLKMKKTRERKRTSGKKAEK